MPGHGWLAGLCVCQIQRVASACHQKVARGNKLNSFIFSLSCPFWPTWTPWVRLLSRLSCPLSSRRPLRRPSPLRTDTASKNINLATEKRRRALAYLVRIRIRLFTIIVVIVVIIFVRFIVASRLRAIGRSSHLQATSTCAWRLSINNALRCLRCCSPPASPHLHCCLSCLVTRRPHLPCRQGDGSAHENRTGGCVLFLLLVVVAAAFFLFFVLKKKPGSVSKIRCVLSLRSTTRRWQRPRRARPTTRTRTNRLCPLCRCRRRPRRCPSWWWTTATTPRTSRPRSSRCTSCRRSNPPACCVCRRARGDVGAWCDTRAMAMCQRQPEPAVESATDRLHASDRRNLVGVKALHLVELAEAQLLRARQQHDQHAGQQQTPQGQQRATGRLPAEQVAVAAHEQTCARRVASGKRGRGTTLTVVFAVVLLAGKQSDGQCAPQTSSQVDGHHVGCIVNLSLNMRRTGQKEHRP